MGLERDINKVVREGAEPITRLGALCDVTVDMQNLESAISKVEEAADVAQSSAVQSSAVCVVGRWLCRWEEIQ